METRNIPKGGWRPAIHLLYSIPKMGKSTLAACFSPKGIDDVIVLDNESGYNDIECNRIEVSSLDTLHQGLLYAAKSQYGTVVIDPIDMPYVWSKKQCLEFANRNKPQDKRYSVIGEIPEGVGWDRSKEILLNAILNPAIKLKELGKVVLLVSHVKAPNDNPVQEKVRTIDLPGSLSRTLSAAVDGIMLMYKDSSQVGDKRYVTMHPYQQVDAGCRWKEWANKIFEIPQDDPFKYLREALCAAETS